MDWHSITNYTFFKIRFVLQLMMITIIIIIIIIIIILQEVICN